MAARVRNDRGPQTNGCAVVYLNTLGILVLKINIISDKNRPMYLDAAQTMQERPQVCRAGQKSGHQMKRPVGNPFEQ
ncbi:MAG: hypothetical protein WB341_03275 [Terracidiphilus sp.]